MKLSERMFARADRMRKRGNRAYAMFLRRDAVKVAKLEAENSALKRLLQNAEDVQEGKMEYSHTFCWWCGGLKHYMTKNSSFYCEGAALLAKESAEDGFALIPTQKNRPANG